MSEPFDRALRAAARRGRSAGVCPDAGMLASYADNGLSADERSLVEAHAADCAICQQHLALLGAVSVERDAPEMSRSWLARWGWLVPVATAVLVVAVWIRLPDQQASRDIPPGPAPATRATAPAVPEQERLASGDAPPASPTGERDAADQTGGRFAAKVSPATPEGPAAPAEAKVDQLAPLERRDAARQKVASAAPPVAAAPPAAATVQSREAGAEKAQALGATSNVTSPAPPAAPAMADVLKEEVTESPRRVEGQLRKSTAAQSPSIVSSSPNESYRFVGKRIELSEDGGATWRTVLSEGQAAFTAAGCVSGGPCWFGAADGQMLRRTAAGFSRSVLPVRAPVVAIAAEGVQTAIVTVEGGQRFRTANGGTTWDPIP